VPIYINVAALILLLFYTFALFCKLSSLLPACYFLIPYIEFELSLLPIYYPVLFALQLLCDPLCTRVVLALHSVCILFAITLRLPYYCIAVYLQSICSRFAFVLDSFRNRFAIVAKLFCIRFAITS
jgi:hypothetical protein